MDRPPSMGLGLSWHSGQKGRCDRAKGGMLIGISIRSGFLQTTSWEKAIMKERVLQLSWARMAEGCVAVCFWCDARGRQLGACMGDRGCYVISSV